MQTVAGRGNEKRKCCINIQSGDHTKSRDFKIAIAKNILNPAIFILSNFNILKYRCEQAIKRNQLLAVQSKNVS